MTQNQTASLRLRRIAALTTRSTGLLAFCLAPLAVGACSSASDTRNPAAVQQSVEGADCGLSITSKVHGVSKKGFNVQIDVANVTGATSLGFSVLINAGDAQLVNVAHGSFQVVEGGYLLTPVASIEDSQLDPTQGYQFELKFAGVYTDLKANIMSSNGNNCDQTVPSISLAESGDFFTANGTLNLTADAIDNVAVAKVVFLQDGVQIGVDTTPPYTASIPVTSVLNGRHRYTATAYDLTGNAASETAKRVLVAIGNKFFGTAVDNAADYTSFLSYFNQITPGNAGKWGSVEATRDVMNWADLDTAHDFAVSNNVPFKLHTLIWGSQQPAWMSGLTADEQLAEIDQWMTALAAQYSDLTLIDVVNEPMHTVPSYSAALGGAGTTGYDWVIKAFEMARAHFPNAELILNEYNVVVMESFTSDFLKIVNLLKDRGLIDGIGEQGHFLEKADPTVVSANLNALASTGLPIYISELDLSITNDEQHANVMSQLFPVLWSNPSVVGVTHWGYRQGATWRPDAHLVRTDGTTRPALDWINCYKAGNSNCYVPTYVPGPRLGEKSGLIIEAEDYDEAHGLIALGNAVAYTDSGDWEKFLRVNFDANWNKLSVSYTKGNSDTSSNLTIHLDSLDNAPVAIVNLPTTGSWSTSATVDVPWTAISGEHTVFVRYNGASGVANVDKIKFTGPTQNLVTNATFETMGTQGWGTWGGGPLVVSSDLFHSGSKSLRVVNSGSTTNKGTASYSLTGSVTAGGAYPVSFWVTVGGTTVQPVKLTTSMTCVTPNSTRTVYAGIANGSATSNVTPGQWTQLKGLASAPCTSAETLTAASVYAEGPAAGVDLYVDDVQVIQPGMSVVTDGTFENGSKGGFYTWAGGTLAATQTLAHNSAWSVLLSGSTGGGNIARDVTGLVTSGQSYVVTYWAATGVATNVKLTTQITCAESGIPGTGYLQLQGSTPTAVGVWTKLAGIINVPNCTVTKVQPYAEGPAAGVAFYADDITVSPFKFE